MEEPRGGRGSDCRDGADTAIDITWRNRRPFGVQNFGPVSNPQTVDDSEDEEERGRRRGLGDGKRGVESVTERERWKEEEGGKGRKRDGGSVPHHLSFYKSQTFQLCCSSGSRLQWTAAEGGHRLSPSNSSK